MLRAQTQALSTGEVTAQDDTTSSDSQASCSLLAELEKVVRTSAAFKNIQEKGIQTEDDGIHNLNPKLNNVRKVTLADFTFLAKCGNVYLKKDVGRDLYAKFIIIGDHLCLCAFSDEVPPPGKTIVEYNDFSKDFSKAWNASNLVYLEFKFYSRYAAQIFIRLTSGTKRAQNFLLMCTGELGRSFLNTNIRKIWRKGCPGEFVECGADGMALVKGAGEEEGGVLERPDLEGCVYGYPGDEIACQFCITTIPDEKHSYSTVFGKVVDGLDQLKTALAEYSDEKYFDDIHHLAGHIHNVKVTNCGVVLIENFLKLGS